MKLHRRFARALGYDIEKQNKQVLLETHLQKQFDLFNVDLVFDVGANAGQFASLLRSVTGYKGEIQSFEPQPKAFAQLAELAARDPDWHIYNYALGETAGELQMNVSQDSVFSSFHPASEAGKMRFAAIKEVETLNVQVKTLEEHIDTEVTGFEQRRAFLKMDTQGHDSWVFQGAGRWKGSFAGIVSEMPVVPIYDNVPDYIDLISVYRKHGYEMTGAYVVHRHRDTGHVVDFDCVMARVEKKDRT